MPIVPDSGLPDAWVDPRPFPRLTYQADVTCDAVTPPTYVAPEREHVGIGQLRWIYEPSANVATLSALRGVGESSPYLQSMPLTLLEDGSILATVGVSSAQVRVTPDGRLGGVVRGSFWPATHPLIASDTVLQNTSWPADSRQLRTFRASDPAVVQTIWSDDRAPYRVNHPNTVIDGVPINPTKLFLAAPDRAERRHLSLVLRRTDPHRELPSGR